ncbi:unnamed protein product [marine sediment metagenome]|uniref:ABC transporter permease n=1 Tax=marine sediment metagenome TaxID=412755 RepID=X1KGC3_9ZZZZ
MAFVIFSVIFLVAGVNPLIGYTKIFKFGFVSQAGLSFTIRNTAPLLFVTLAFILPLKAGLWNIGADGQYIMGALAVTGVSFAFSNLPSGILIPLMMLGAVIFGGAWAAIPSFLKIKMGVNEIITTLLLNYVAVLLVLYLVVGGPWMGGGQAESRIIPTAGQIPNIGDTIIPYTIFIAIGLAILLFFLINKSRIGYEIRACGSNPLAAKYAGISSLKISLIAMMVGGAIAALGGFHQVSGVLNRLRPDVSPFPGWGYYGIVFGLIANKNFLLAILSTFFFSGMLTGGNILQSELGMPFGVLEFFMGTLMICLITGQFFYTHKIVIK